MDATELEALRLRFAPLSSEPFWEAVQEQRLLLQQCARCGTVRHYPRLVCPHCYSEQAERIEVLGDGELYTWTIVHRAFDLAFKHIVPYTVGLVTLPQGVRVMGHIWQDAQTELRIGLPLRFAPRHIHQTFWVPAFVPRAAAT